MNKKQIEQSDRRILGAMEVLNGHERGRAVLRDLKLLSKGPMQGLDRPSFDAFITLVEEYASGRRTFLESIPIPGYQDVTGPDSLNVQSIRWVHIEHFPRELRRAVQDIVEALGDLRDEETPDFVTAQYVRDTCIEPCPEAERNPDNARVADLLERNNARLYIGNNYPSLNA